MVHQVNRGAEILKNWNRYQRELETSIGAGIPAMGIKKEKYNFLIAGLARLSVQPTMDEGIYSRMITAMVKRLRKEIYPNRLLRTVIWFRDQMFRIPKIKSDLQKTKQKNFVALDEKVKNMGIDNMSGYLASQFDHERSSVYISLVSRFRGDNSLGISFNIEKDGNGYYQVDNMEASLFVPGEMNRQCLIDDRYGLQVDQVYGAAMVSRSGNETAERWGELDFSRTDDNAHHQLGEIRVERGFELDQMLKSASENIGYVGINRPEVLKLLAGGVQTAFKIEGLGNFSLEAHPRNSELVFRDGQQKVIPTATLKKRITDHLLLQNSV